MTTSAPGFRTRVRGIAEPVARGLGQIGLTPNHLTLIGFGIAIAAAVGAATQAWLAAGLLVLFGGAFDLLDGALARATNRVNRLGAFMDSVFDRWGEGVIYVGIAYGCVAAGFGWGAILAAAALSAAVMVSYIRAKSEGLGFTSGTGMASVGSAPREVRVVALGAGLIAAWVAGPVGPLSAECNGLLALCVPPDFFVAGDITLALTLGLITILATITTIQRIVHVINQSRGDTNS